MQVVIDLDGVVYNYVETFGDCVARATGRPREEFPPATHWNFFEDWGLSLDEFKTHMSNGVKYDDLFWVGNTFPGAHAGWSKLTKRPDTVVHVVSDRSPAGSEDEALRATMAWLWRNEFHYNAISITADKVDAVNKIGSAPEEVWTIEDRDKNYLAYKEAGFNSFLMTQDWNLHVEDAPRVKSLAEFVDLIP